MTDLLTQKNTESVNFQPNKKKSGPPSCILQVPPWARISNVKSVLCGETERKMVNFNLSHKIKKDIKFSCRKCRERNLLTNIKINHLSLSFVIHNGKVHVLIKQEGKKVKSAHEPTGPCHTARAYPSFRSMKSLGVLLLLLDGMLVHLRSPPPPPPPIFCQVSLTVCQYPFILLGGESTMTWQGLEPGPLDPESSTLTTRPPHLPHHTRDCQ